MKKIDISQVAREMFPDEPHPRRLGHPAGDLKLVPLRLVAMPEGVMKEAPLRDLKRALTDPLRQEQVQVTMTVAFAQALLDALRS